MRNFHPVAGLLSGITARYGGEKKEERTGRAGCHSLGPVRVLSVYTNLYQSVVFGFVIADIAARGVME